MKIGLQVYSIRNEATDDFAAAMQQVKAMGYDGVEIASRYGLTAKQMKAIADEIGLEIISAHAPMQEMETNPKEAFSFYREVGCRYVAVPWMPKTDDAAVFDERIERIRSLGMKAKEEGIQLLYHNHDFEFVKFDGEYGLDKLYRVIEPEYLEPELDTCWVKVADEDPAEYIKKYSGRTPIIHLKDFYMEDDADKEGMYELIGVEKRASARSSFEFRCVGHGKQHFPSIIEAAKESGAEWLIVEQDNPSQGLTPMECADISRKYLKSIGL